MRGGSASVFGLIGSLCLAMGAAMGACSGDVVNEEPSGAGPTGSGGGTTTTTTTVTATATETPTDTATNTNTNTDTGPMTVCDEACAHAAECGLNICGFQMLDCANRQYECAAECIKDASCEQILSIASGDIDPALGVCLYVCQNGGQGGGGQGEQCGTCLFQNDCLDPIQTCPGATDCDAWGDCASACAQSDPQPSCFDACDAQYPGAAPAYSLVYECGCTSCETDCTSMIDPCNQGGSGAGGAGGAGGTGGSGGMTP